ncbi:YrzI family small protein [Aestuariibaculum sp. TT11]|uniref:YrzI family small protein n=1 Tax=Aestuariibaculum sediminum TaxID=2770637 RepID=A0A8J6QHX6_9FLAO|nr:YrzI family small protein [Aestuariibaculum sediminum]
MPIAINCFFFTITIKKKRIEVNFCPF